MKKPIIALLSTLITIAVFSACTVEIDPLAFCKNLEPNSVEKLLNSSYKEEPVSSLNEKIKGCKYISETIEGRTFNIIASHADYPAQTLAAYEKAVNVWKNGAFENRDLSEVSQIGDKAFWAFNQKTPQLITYQETKLLIITLGNFNLESADQLEVAKQIATTLFEKQW